MPPEIKRECPRCYNSRTLLDTSFALPGYHPDCKDAEKPINEKCILPVKVLLCPNCHLLELYHDVSVKP
jgi:hypothetical protein